MVQERDPPSKAANSVQAYLRRLATTRLLIVDDLATMRKLIAAVARELGITQIAEASNGREALEHLAHHPVDLLICDWNMPGRTGLEVLQKVRADPRFRDLPVLMVTAEGSSEQVKEAIAAGVTSYVVKPFLPTTLKLAYPQVPTPTLGQGKGVSLNDTVTGNRSDVYGYHPGSRSGATLRTPGRRSAPDHRSG